MREFEWDPAKSQLNLSKHGIDFASARALWDAPTLEGPTYPGNDPERRFVVGVIGGKHWTAIITYREGRTRIISVRRSRKSEVRAYDYFKGRKEADNRRGV